MGRALIARATRMHPPLVTWVWQVRHPMLLPGGDGQLLKVHPEMALPCKPYFGCRAWAG